MAGLDATIKFITKPLGTAPGWAILLVAAYWFVDTGMPQQVTGKMLEAEPIGLPDTVWALGLTLIFYMLGDLLDEAIFKKRLPTPKTKSSKERQKCPRFDPSWVKNERRSARKRLRIEGGSYSVAMAVVKKAGKNKGVDFCNETAKFLRSLVVPLILAAIFSIGVTSLTARVVIFFLSIVFLVVYVLLKLFHIRLLYRRAQEVASSANFQVKPWDSVNAYLWKGSFVTTANPKILDPCIPTHS